LFIFHKIHSYQGYDLLSRKKDGKVKEVVQNNFFDIQILGDPFKLIFNFFNPIIKNLNSSL